MQEPVTQPVVHAVRQPYPDRGRSCQVKAERALEKIGANEVQDSSVIMVEMANKAGVLERISKIMAEAGINIYYFYATIRSGKTATCMIKTADDKKTSKILSQA